MAEGARLESVYTGNRIGGSNPSLSAISYRATQLVLAEVDLSDPDPNPVEVFLFYDHPSIPDRVQFCLTYNPRAKGQQGRIREVMRG